MGLKAGSVYIGVKADLSPFEKSMRNAKRKAVGFAKNIDTSFATMKRQIFSVKNAVFSLGAAFAALQVVRVADQYTNLNSRLKLVTTSSEELATVQGRLYQIAQESRSAYIATADVFTRFAQATRGQGVSSKELLGITESLNKAFIISGATTEETSSVLIQLSQAFSKGKLDGEEFRAVMESGSRVVTMLTDYLGKTRGELIEMARRGEITAKVFRGALAEGLGDVRKEFEQMDVTAGQAWVQLKNAMGSIIDETNKASGGTNKLSKTIQELTQFVENNKSSFVTYGTVAVSAINTMIRSAKRFLDIMVKVDELISGTNHGTASGRWLEGTQNRIKGLREEIERLEGLRGRNSSGQGRLPELRRQLSLLEDQVKVFKDSAEGAGKTVVDLDDGLAIIEPTARKTKVAISDLGDGVEDSGKKAKYAGREYDSFTQELALMQEGWAKAARELNFYEREFIQATDTVEQSTEAMTEAVASDIDSLMAEQAELWGFGNEKVIELQEQLVNDMGQIMTGFVDDVLRGEIDNIGDMFESLFDSILDMFIRLTGQIAANSIMEAIGLSTGTGLSIQGLLGSGGGGALSLASIGSTVASGASTVGGWLGLGSGGVTGGTGGAVIGAATPAATAAAIEAAAASGATAGVNAGTQLALAEGTYGTTLGGSGLGSSAAGLGAAAAIAYGAYSFANVAFTDNDFRPMDPEHGFGDLRQYSGFFSRNQGNWQRYTNYNSGEEPIGYETFIHDMTTTVTGELRSMSDKASHIVADMSEVMGLEWVGLAQSIKDTTPSMDKFIDRMAGFNVEIKDSAKLHQLARDAAGGSTDALVDLRSGLEDVGMSAFSAEAAAIAMVGAIEDFNATPIVIDTEINVELTGDVNSQGNVTVERPVDAGSETYDHTEYTAPTKPEEEQQAGYRDDGSETAGMRSKSARYKEQPIMYADIYIGAEKLEQVVVRNIRTENKRIAERERTR